MKVRIEIENNLIEDEVIIRCSEINNNIQKIQTAISNVTSEIQKIACFKENIEVYLPLEQILFFETNGNSVDVHITDDVYSIKHRLYELEEILPRDFIRISKSTIVNSHHIFSITRNLTASSLVQFHNSHKQVYVSRYYYKDLRKKINERRRL